MDNKRGQGLSTNAIILIILGVVVLVVLILGFTMGWDRIAPWISSSNNVDAIVKQCAVACGSLSKYDFCSVEREIKFEATIDGLKSGDKKTCNSLTEFTELGIEKCPAITCATTTEESSEEE